LKLISDVALIALILGGINAIVFVQALTLMGVPRNPICFPFVSLKHKLLFMKVVLAIFLSSCPFSLTLGQDTYPNKKFTIQELREDFTVFRESLEEAHPGLYWFNSKDEMDRLFNDVSASLKESNEQVKHLMIEGLPNYKMDSLKKMRYGSNSKIKPFIQLTGIKN